MTHTSNSLGHCDDGSAARCQKSTLWFFSCFSYGKRNATSISSSAVTKCKPVLGFTTWSPSFQNTHSPSY
ncbi:hypothetical protein T4E_8398 [Trichinella pseudospiralis]|uniref:Uncharacterized protein n=1 Tax=Trichinella pseudospiralis TaxID=6337 RepID=A0A0V0YH42_TRIPS|nr:hypothetical protein T4E_8398 [Trichinella pseudospiralis]KRY84196.1 hypothetical protein T4D_13987 [Trichinella pseudospiralis]